MQLTDKQYEILLHMYHNWVEMFCSLPDATKDAFYRRLLGEYRSLQEQWRVVLRSPTRSRLPALPAVW